MLKRFRVQNFMCLKDVTVDLEPLTIFVGPNSSGKSAFFKALTTFTKLLHFPLRGDIRGDFYVESGITLDDAVWRGDTALPIVFEAWFLDSQSQDPDYTLELRRDYRGWNVMKEKFLFNGKWLDTSTHDFEFPIEQGKKTLPGPYRATLPYLTYRYIRDTKAGPYLEPIQDLRRSIGEARRYRPSAIDIASFVRPPKKPPSMRLQTREPYVDETGKGFALALQNVWKVDRQIFDSIQEELKRLHSHIIALDFIRDYRGTGMVYKTDRVMLNTLASLESDGVLLSTFLLWRIYTAQPNLKICLEEPENGVHISALKERYQLLKRFTEETAKERNVQILVATHSRDFLNAIDSRNDILDEIRVVEFAPDAGTNIHTLHHYREIDQLLSEVKYQMGDLWWSSRLQHKLTS